MSCCAQPMMAVNLSDAPILKEGDADTLWQNVCTITNNSVAIIRNVARIGARIVVDSSGSVAKATKYLADHPKASMCAVLGSYILYCKWSNLTKIARRRYNSQQEAELNWEEIFHTLRNMSIKQIVLYL